MKKAIQFIGTQRSGSNLLRVMLNQHPEISAPHPPHILQVLMPLLPMYGEPSDPMRMTQSGFEKLIDDVCTLVEKNPVSWSVKFDRAAIAGMCENNSLPQIMRAIYWTKALAKNAPDSYRGWWCCKSMASIHYVDEIESAGIHPVYLFMYRDGRDVACSFRKAVVGEKHMYFLAMQWKKEQELSYALMQKLGSERVISLCYEDFMADTEGALKKICKSLHIEFVPEMLDYAEAEESKITAASGKMWGNLTKPLLRGNSKKYLRELSHDDLVIFESVAGDTLEMLGYTREIPSGKLRTFSESEIREFEILNSRWKAEAKELSVEDMTKRKAQDEFIAALKKNYDEITNATRA